MWRRIIASWKGLAPGQQISVVILGVCGVLALGLSAYRVRQNVYAPFLVNRTLIAEAKKVVGVTEDQIIEQQKLRDTDGDGLSDWDEANKYRTNPNIYDTCGDGMPDNVRVLTGKNLNCSETGANISGRLDLKILDQAPTEGQIGYVSDGSDVPIFDQQFLQELAAKNPSLVSDGTATTGDGAVDPTAQARDPQLIRQALIGRVDSATLDKLTDEQLLKMFDNAVAKQASNTNGGSQ